MKPTLKLLFAIFLIFIIQNELWAGNNCNTATSISNDMNSFETYSNLGNTSSSVPAPPCGDYTTSDFWFSTTVPPSGFLSVVILPGTMTDPAMAIYTGSCNNLNLEGCSAEDFCGDESSAIFEESGLTPGTTYYIRVWAVGGAPNGTFEIRVSSANPPPAIPLDLDVTVGNANNSTGGCIQLTTTGNFQEGCAWNSTQEDMTQIFEKIVVLNFGTNDGGADGITLAFQNSPAGSSACGVGGGGIAADGVLNSLFFEFDTWDNGAAVGDLPQDHAAVFINGDNTNIIAGPVVLNGGNIETGEDFPVKITWNGVTFDFEVYFDNVLVLSGNYDIVTNSLGGGNMAYWGTTASTGGANNNQSICPFEPEAYFGGTEQIVDVTICEGDTYFAGGANQTTTGVYTDNTPIPNGCQDVTTTNLTVIPSATSTLNEVVCDGDCITIGTNNTFCTTGNYSVTLSGESALGCDSVVTLDLQVLDPFAFVVQNPTPTIDCDNSTITLDGGFSSTGVDITYSWAGPCIISGFGTPFIEVDCEGSYTLTVTQTIGNTSCTSFSSVTVVEDLTNIIADAGPNQTLDCTTGCVFLDGTNSTTGSTVQYLWTGPNGFISNLQNPEVCESGTYNLIVEDISNNCLGSDMVEVFPNTPPTADAGPDATIDCDNATATLGGNSTSGNDFTLTWLDDTGATVGSGTTFTTSDEGTYTLVVTNNATGCSSSDDAIVSGNNIIPNADAGPDAVITCNNTSATLSGSGSDSGPNITLTWLDDTGTPVGNGPILITSEEGTYTLVASNSSNNCFSTDEVIVTENTDAPFVDAGPDMAIDCNNSSVTLVGFTPNSGTGFTLVWENSGGIQVGSGLTLTTSDAGIYTFTVTNILNGCSSVDIVDVGDNSVFPNADAGPDMAIDCDNTTVTLISGNTDPDFELIWEDDMGNQVGLGSIFTTGITGTYTLVVTNTTNGCSSSDEVVISDNTNAILADAGADMTIDCDNTTVTLDGNNSDSGVGVNLVWFDSNGSQVGVGSTFSTSDDDTYTLVVTDTGTGCSSDDIVVVSLNNTFPNVDAGLDIAIDCDNTTVTLDGSNSDTGTGFELTWQDDMGNTVEMGNTFTTGNTGTYTLVVTNTSNGCSASDDVIISGNSNLPNADAGVDMAIDCDNTTVTLDGSNSDTGTGFELTWQDDMGNTVEMGNTFTTGNTGTYTLVVTNTSNGCSASDEVIISGNSNLPNADAGVNMAIDCDNTTVTLDGSNSDTGTGFELTWQDDMGNTVEMGNTFTTGNTGTYTLVVTNTSNGCSASDDVIISGNSNLPNADAGVDMAIDCDNTTVTLDGSNSDTGTGFELTWQDDMGNTVEMGNTFTTGNTGTYTLVVTNTSNGCSASDDVIISGNSNLPNADAGVDMAINCDNTTVTLDGSNSDTGTGFELTWQDDMGNTVEMGNTFTTGNTGTYTLVVTNTSNGCSASDDVIISGNTNLPFADAGADIALSCSSPNVTLDGSNSDNGMGFTLSWENANGDEIGLGNTLTTSDIGVYTLVVTNDATGCSNSDDVVVTGSSNLPTADAGQDVVLNCNISQTILNGSNSSSGTDFTYEWQNSNQDSIGEEVLLTVTDSDTYTLIVTDNSNGCTQSDFVIITYDTLAPIADAGIGGTISCTPTAITLDGSNSSTGVDFTYEWFNSTNTNIGSGITIDISSADTFTLVVTNQLNGCSASDEVIIQQDTSVPAAFASSDGDITCTNLQVTLDATGSETGNDIEYQWQDNLGNPLGNELTLTTPNSGIYTLVVTNTSTSCSSSTNVVVQENMVAPTIDILFPDTITCTNTQVTLDGSNSSVGTNFDYNWLDADLVTIDTELITSVSNADFYTLVITDMANGCTVAETIEVIQEGAVPIANISLATDVLDCNNEDITLSYSGPTGNNIVYQWMNGNTLLLENQDLTVNTIGIYSLVVTNTDNGCSTDASVEIFQDFATPQITTSAGTITCIQPNVTLNGTGSSNGADFTYEWQNNLGNSLSNNISLVTNESGIYTFIVTDNSNGCSIGEQITVIENISTVISDAGQDATITCGTNLTTLDGGNSSTGMDINYEWTNTSGSPLGNNITLDVNVADTFILIVTDGTNGCADTSSVEVFQDSSLPTVDIASSGLLTCADTIVNLSGVNSNGTGTITFSWTDANGVFISNEDNIDITTIGNYNLVVTDMANGCSANETFLVEENVVAPISDAGMDVALSCTVTSATLNGINSSIGAGISYEWISPNGTTAGFAPILTTSESGTFTLVVTNNMNGCSAESTANVAPSAAQPTATILPPQPITCSQSQVTLIGAMSSGSGTLSYQWYNSIGQPIGNDPNLTISQSGIYILDVVDSPSGCVASTSVLVEGDITPPIANTNAAGVLTCNQSTYMIDASNSSVGSGFGYEWQDDNGNTLNNEFSYTATTIGTYNLIVTNIANGCTATTSTTVTEDLSTPNPVAIAQGMLTCQDNMVTLDATSSTGSNGSPLTFEWFNPMGNAIGIEGSVDVNEAGDYEVVLTNNLNGCTAMVDVTVLQDTVAPQPSIEAITNLSLDCNQSSLVVDGSNSLPLGNVTYEWVINNNVISSVSNPQIDEAGDLILVVTDNQNGCTASTSVTITIDEETPNITIANPETLNCNITTTELDASDSSVGNDFTYEWTGPGTIINETTLNPTIDQAGTYLLTITNSSNGCTAEADISVAEDVTPPTININPADEFDCTTFSITLDASNSSTGNDFTTQWTTTNGNIDNNANTLNPNISLPGEYTLEITNTLNGCVATESITVTESSAVISGADIIINNPLCFGDNGDILIESVNGGTPPFVYSIDFQPFTTNSSFNFLDAGNYDIIIEDAEGCQFSEEVTINNVTELILDLPERELIKLGESYEMQPQISFPISEIDTFIWTPSDSLTCTDCPNPVANPLNSTFYELTIISENGCIATDGILIAVEKPREVFIPNVFTPNGDGTNDIFQIFANNNMVKQVNKFQVFTRWGELVFSDEDFQPNSPEHGWDGFFNGKKINPSVLVYYAEIEFIDGFVEVFKGDVTLR